MHSTTVLNANIDSQKNSLASSSSSIWQLGAQIATVSQYMKDQRLELGMSFTAV